MNATDQFAMDISLVDARKILKRLDNRTTRKAYEATLNYIQELTILGAETPEEKDPNEILQIC